MTTKDSRRGALGRVCAGLSKVDTFVWVLLGTAVVAGLSLAVVVSFPPDANSLALDLFDADNKFVKYLIAGEEAEDLPNWLRSYKPAKGRDRGAGLLGVLSRSDGKELASIFGRDSAQVQPAGRAARRDPPANGYWANTYVPGDPAVRLLRAQLGDAGKVFVQSARPYRQAFDPPESSALSVYLQADRQRVASQTRMLLQVGLQGTERRGGRRPEMNVAVVLDWRQGSPTHVGASARALLMALCRARDIGDRFTLVVAGASTEIVVKGKDFRHGPLTVALQRLAAQSDRLGSKKSSKEANALSLSDAYKRASTMFDTDDPAAPLSSNLLLLLATGDLKAELPRLQELARRSAAVGVPTSVVGVGSAIGADQLTALALAGQGHRRLLGKPAEAQALVEHELSAAAGMVARAVRLRIRLAGGVRLVDILGSRPLAEVQARRVRMTEQRIDQRVAKKLGVAVDRGKDEDGIQIVIPAYYAGDSHVILLDVVAGPGPIADVTARFKDLVFLRNGVTRAQLALPRGADARRGPLQVSVVKNLLSYRTSLALRQAATLLRRGQHEEATTRLQTWRSELKDKHRDMPTLRRDPDVLQDLALLQKYRSALDRSSPQKVRLLSGSLQVAAHYKAHSCR